jgi:hypothetical protein
MKLSDADERHSRRYPLFRLVALAAPTSTSTRDLT